MKNLNLYKKVIILSLLLILHGCSGEDEENIVEIFENPYALLLKEEENKRILENEKEILRVMLYKINYFKKSKDLTKEQNEIKIENAYLKEQLQKLSKLEDLNNFTRQVNDLKEKK